MCYASSDNAYYNSCNEVEDVGLGEQKGQNKDQIDNDEKQRG